MKLRLHLSCILLLGAIGMTACKENAYHACQCYKGGYESNKYEIGAVSTADIKKRCLAVQQQNQEDLCEGADLHK